jgi:hypothetical protein
MMENHMKTGRDLFEKSLKGETLVGPAFVPLVSGLAARAEGVPHQTLLA